MNGEREGLYEKDSTGRGTFIIGESFQKTGSRCSGLYSCLGSGIGRELFIPTSLKYYKLVSVVLVTL